MSKLRRMSRTDVIMVLKSKKQIRSQHFSIVYNNDKKGYATVVSKKIERLAVNRNKTKRRVRSILQKVDNLNKSYVIFVKSNIIKTTYEDVQKELQSLIIKV